jgi:hypothetical protein
VFITRPIESVRTVRLTRGDFTAEPELRTNSMERRGHGGPLSFLCPCGQRIALKALGCCRSCYDRRDFIRCAFSADCGSAGAGPLSLP